MRVESCSFEQMLPAPAHVPLSFPARSALQSSFPTADTWVSLLGVSGFQAPLLPDGQAGLSAENWLHGSTPQPWLMEAGE